MPAVVLCSPSNYSSTLTVNAPVNLHSHAMSLCCAAGLPKVLQEWADYQTEMKLLSGLPSQVGCGLLAGCSCYIHCTIAASASALHCTAQGHVSSTAGLLTLHLNGHTPPWPYTIMVAPPSSLQQGLQALHCQALPVVQHPSFANTPPKPAVLHTCWHAGCIRYELSPYAAAAAVVLCLILFPLF
jgi:hypothetical protein